jgi:hypothetical protein
MQPRVNVRLSSDQRNIVTSPTAGMTAIWKLGLTRWRTGYQARAGIIDEPRQVRAAAHLIEPPQRIIPERRALCATRPDDPVLGV